MGITGLLPYLAKATKECHISEFRGGTVAVDSYCLLHKGANACVEQLARGEDNQMYVRYCIKYVKLLLSYDIHPIMVFDGRNLPAKAETETKRREARKKAKQRAAELLKLGKSDEARTYLKQSINITPQMAFNLIKECRNMNVDCIVAPYESDAQLAFFSIKGVADCVITEDSDLVLFGCKKVLYKLDLGGAGRLVESDKIASVMKMRPDEYTFDKFRYMCILSGCDYVSSLGGIGLKKAEKFLKLTAETNPEIFLDRIPRYLNMKHLEITEEYKKNVLIANATFLHQVVFDPYKKKLVHLIDPELTGTNPDYLINAGDKFDDEKAFQIALGNLNPFDFEQFDNWVPSEPSQNSIWSTVYKKRIPHKEQKLIQKIKLQEYLESKSVNDEHTKIEKELQITEEDCQIDKELSVYTTKKVQINEQIQVEVGNKESEETQNKTQISPILAKNPFLKKKRLSKFPKTFSYGQAVVKSRFFCSESSLRTEPVSTSKDSECENNSSLTKEEIVITEEINTQSTNTECSFQPNDILKSCENTTEMISKKRSLVLESSEDITDNSECKVIEIDEDEKQGNTISNKKTEPSHGTKKRKLGPCRTIGLKKKAASQQTLHNFFDKMKKPE